MPKLEVFFDYACPFCLRGHESLAELLPGYPGLEIDWLPCEAHPRPERYGPHSDLCARGMYIALEHNADLMEYHRRMYHAALSGDTDIEDLRVVSGLMKGLLDCDAFYSALSGGDYQDRLSEKNRLAWETYGFPAVPSFRMEGETLESIENVGVSKERLAEFLDKYAPPVN